MGLECQFAGSSRCRASDVTELSACGERKRQASMAHTSSGRACRSQTKVTSTQALLRGLTGRCPNCGRGHMFGRYLKVVESCPVCGEELFHHRADDFPAYLVILIVGHTVVPLSLLVETEYAPALWLQVALWLPLTGFLSLALLQPIKGAIVAMQWFGGMHGASRPPSPRLTPPPRSGYRVQEIPQRRFSTEPDQERSEPMQRRLSGPTIRNWPRTSANLRLNRCQQPKDVRCSGKTPIAVVTAETTHKG
jgi:uncharacterized protein (DUF983 family)